MQIKDITNIQTGLFAKPSGIGEVVYLQVRHFDDNGELLRELNPDLMADCISEKHLLKDGDVLFAAKGTKNFATVFENHNELSVASTSFFVIRPTDKRILPAYLAWFINNPKTQSFLKGQSKGTSIPSISKNVLENLEFSLPSIETQQTILYITELRKKEKALKQELETLREKVIQKLIFNSIN